jgi:hypothetical protein
VLDNGTILVSSQATSAVHHFDSSGRGGAIALGNLLSVADIAVDAKRQRLLLVLTEQNKMEVHDIPR